MRILAIETSCDDTCIAVAKGGKSFLDFQILSSFVSSQIRLHRKFGGVWPFLARREHEKNLVYVLKKSLKEVSLLKKRKEGKKLERKSLIVLERIFKKEKLLFQKTINFFETFKKPKIDIIAVTVGPGLEPCLWCGVNFARAIAFWLNIKIIPVNHIEAHIFSSFLSKRWRKMLEEDSQKIFPSIALIVSGGHTQLILVRELGHYKILGETRDDAAGEAFDKIARILGLPYPGGPEIEKMARDQDFDIPKYQIKLPRPMIHSKDYDFSFSGLKTAVLYDYRKRPEEMRKSKEYISTIAREAQEAIVEVLVKKTIKAQKEFGAKSIILGGGVVANQRLKEVLKREVKRIKNPPLIFFPERHLATDNAEMVALCGYFHFRKSDRIKNWKGIKAYSNLEIS